MNSPEFGMSHQEEYLTALHETEEMVVDFADKNLATSEVSIVIEDLYSLSDRLPTVFWDKFYDIEKPTQAATGVNLGLRYDRQNQHFTPTHATIHFDNGCSAEFLQSQRMREHGAFYFQVLDETGAAIQDTRGKETPLFDTSELRAILGQFNVSLPDNEQPAEWAEIVGMLSFCRFWSTATEHSVPISPKVDVRIRDEIRASMPHLTLTPAQSFDRLWQRHLILSIDTKNRRLLPASSLQLMLESDDLKVAPTYNDLSRVPVYYEHEQVDKLLLPQFLEEPPLVRIEKNHKRKTVVPRLPLLRALQKDVELAQAIVED